MDIARGFGELKDEDENEENNETRKNWKKKRASLSSVIIDIYAFS